MAKAPSQTMRLIVLLACVCVAAAAIAWQVQRRARWESKTLVDIREPLNQLLEAHASTPAQPTAGDDDYPPALARGPLDEATAKQFFHSLGRTRFVYDPLLYYRSASNLALYLDFSEHPAHGWTIRTNSLGMREDSEPSAIKPDLRLLFAGASNVEALCANAESAANLLEADLLGRLGGKTVEALNAGVGSSNFYNYLPVLERYRDLRPDAFIVIAHGGTDFSNALPLERYFRQRGPWAHEAKSCQPLLDSEDPFVRQLVGTEVGSVVHMIAEPEDLQRSIDIACSICAEIEKICRADGIRFICVYLPPPLVGQPSQCQRQRAEVLQRLEITEEQLSVSDRIADGWLAFLQRRGIEHVDLRPTWRATSERLYWRTDTHINLAGQRAVADALLPLFDRSTAPGSTR
jgi:hypothetical protein